MATSAWFNYNGYMNNKLAQLQKAEPAAGWNMEKLVKTFSDVGFVGDAGAEMHFEQYGQYENVAPNAFFNATEYLRAKAAQFYGIDAKAVTDLQAADMQVAIQKAGMSAWSHYEKYGNTEKVNPSNSFDTEAYMNAKLVAVNAVPGGKQYTLPELYEAFQAAGYSALEHFMIYGGNGGAGEVTQKIVDGKIPSEFSVPENKKVNTGGSSDGETFTLTSGIDNITGTAGNDTFVAGSQAGQATLNAGDQLNGGDGIDTLKIYSGVTNFSGATLKSIEIVEDYDGSAAINVSANADIKEIWLNKASTNVATAAKTQIIGFGDATGGSTGGVGVTAVGTFTDVAGTADAATIAVKDAGKATAYAGITAAGVETLTINASGTNKLGTLTAVDAAKLIITGSGSVSTTLSNHAAYKTIDASAATGNISINATAATASAQVLDIMTGTGNDEYITLFANLTKEDKINLGAGTDTLTFNDATDLSTAAKAGVLAGVTGVEVLKATAGAFAVNGDVVAQSLFNHSSTGAFTGTNFANTDKLTIGDVTTAASTVGMKLGQTTFNLDLAGGATSVSNNAAGITVTGASTVNVNSAGTLGVGNNVLGLTTDGNGTVNVTGSHNLTLTAGVAGGATTGLSIAAGTFTGKLNVTGSAQADNIVGGTGADRIDGGLLGDSLTGGAGADTFVYGGTVADLYTGSLAVAGGYDKITDFVAGTDKIALVNTTAVTGVTVTAVTVATADDVAALLTAIGTQVAASGSGGANANAGLITVTAGAMAGTYVFVNDTANAATNLDTLIDVTGVTGTITAADFAFA